MVVMIFTTILVFFVILHFLLISTKYSVQLRLMGISLALLVFGHRLMKASRQFKLDLMMQSAEKSRYHQI